MRILGIDEAGRGCVLGDLVVAGFVVEGARVGSRDRALRKAGAADSKALSHNKRLAARHALEALGTADVRTVTADEIDGGNLNHLEEAVIVDLIRRWEPDQVIVDALGHPSAMPKTIARLQSQLGDLCPRWTMEPKADATFPVVGAASIFAKTTRDARLEAHAAMHGDLGSGYPSDPKTRAWLEAWARTGEPWPSFVRTRWATIDFVNQQVMF